MSKAIQQGKPRPNRGNVVKNNKRIKQNEEILSRLKAK